jgi:hypothetical protein
LAEEATSPFRDGDLPQFTQYFNGHTPPSVEALDAQNFSTPAIYQEGFEQIQFLRKAWVLAAGALTTTEVDYILRSSVIALTRQ